MSTKKTRVITKTVEMLHVANRLKSEGLRTGVVPTMGALHEGHLSLVRKCLEESDRTIVTIFVNPTQFAPTDDLGKYPRQFDEDLELLQGLGVDFVFAPSDQEIYPDGFSTSIVPPNVAMVLEGDYRPDHFAGVATVVLKLFNITHADVAFFGQKDYQQTLVIRHLVRDLNVDTQIIVCPIVRDADGLALSSRNVYLSRQQRQQALSLSQALAAARQLFENGQKQTAELENKMAQVLRAAGIEEIDYAITVDGQTLRPIERIEDSAACLIAAHVGNTRLIDNSILI